MIYEEAVTVAPDDVLINDGRLYILSHGRLTVQYLVNNERLFDIQTDNDVVDMIISEDRLLVFTYSGVTVYGTDTLTETDINTYESGDAEVSQ